MKDMPIRNGYYVLAQQLRGEIIRAPNTTKKFNELLFVFFIGKEESVFHCNLEGTSSIFPHSSSI
jgi:hypothetical protein